MCELTINEIITIISIIVSVTDIILNIVTMISKR